MTTPETETISTATLAACLELSTRQVQRLAREGVLHRAGHGAYELVPSIRGFVRHALAGNTDHDPADLAAAKKALLIEQARAAKRRNDEADNALISRADVLFQMQVATAGAVALIESLPGRTAGEVAAMTDPAVIRAYLLREVREVRNLISNKFAELKKLPLPAMPTFCPLCDSRLKEAE